MVLHANQIKSLSPPRVINIYNDPDTVKMRNLTYQRKTDANHFY